MTPSVTVCDFTISDFHRFMARKFLGKVDPKRHAGMLFSEIYTVNCFMELSAWRLSCRASSVDTRIMCHFWLQFSTRARNPKLRYNPFSVAARASAILKIPGHGGSCHAGSRLFASNRSHAPSRQAVLQQPARMARGVHLFPHGRSLSR
jgi:hypothetical protein